MKIPLPPIDTEFLLDFIVELLNNPSPTGFAEAALSFTGETLLPFTDLSLERTPKGALMAVWKGTHHDCGRAVTAHADTLGAMVREIKSNGRLKMTQIGGYPWNTIEGESCTIFTAGGNQHRGSILLDKASVHIFGKKIEEIKRSEDNMEIRLDVQSSNAAETRALGIEVGDFIAFDTRTEVVNDFIRSRHLDDKAGVACLVSAVKTLHDVGLKPACDTYLLVSNYEECGHGAAADIPAAVDELLTVDMAVVGEGQNSDEFHASLCVKDSGGPYHHGLSQRMRQLAEMYEIPYKVDTYPHYGSDGESYWRAGGNAAVALIGPGIDASHHYERTHMNALIAATKWIVAFLLNK